MNCLASENFEYTENEKTYKLLMDSLMIKDTTFKIMVPPSLVGPLLAYIQLLGHKGLAKMIQDLDSYYFEGMYSIVKTFVTSCYSCFLSYTGNKNKKLACILFQRAL